AIIVNAVLQPTFSTLLLDRFLVSLEAKGIKPIVLVSKKDLADEETIEKMRQVKQAYEKIGYQFVFTTLHAVEENTSLLERISDLLKGEVSVLMGQSGVGKSSLLNALHPTL